MIKGADLRSSLKAYALGVAILALTVMLRLALDPLMGDALPLVTLFGAVAAAVWLGGYRLAIPVAVAGYLICHYLFIPPRGYLNLSKVSDIAGLLAYTITCSLIIVFGEAARIAQTRATERREVLRVTLRSIGDAVITTDMAARVTYINEVAMALTGWSHEEALGQPLERVFPIVNEVTRQPVENPAVRALRQGIVVGLANHTVLIKKDGTECPIDDSAAPIRDEQGHVSGCVLIFREVTAQRMVERDKANQLMTARLLASIVESSNDAIIGKSLDGIIQSWNAAAERLFGFTAEQAVGRHISLVIPSDRMPEEDKIIASLRAGQRIEHYETERVHSNGQRITVSLTISPIKDDSGNVIGASKIVRDITRRKRVESDRQKFVTLIENSTDFIGMCDLNGVPFFVNRAGLEMIGLDIEEARRTSLSEFFFPEDQDMIMNQFLPEVLKNGHGEVEVRFRHFKTGRSRWMSYKVLALTDDANKPVGFATVSQDVTERKRLEDDLRRLAADLAETDRRKNEFLATLAHELRNPLAPMSNMLEAVKRASDDPELVRRAHDTIERQLGQMVRLVDDLLDLNRITHDRLELRRSEVELSSVVQQAVEVARPLVDSAGHNLIIDLPDEPLYLNADRARLAQLFGNLLNNSSRYTRPNGTISLSAERVDREVAVRVKDNGAGIPPDKLNSIFDMFTQVDRESERSQGGLGIGLTLVKRLAEMHGGSIEARSAGEGQGSEFIVRLPVLSKPALAAQTGSTIAPESSPQRSILVVDDNRDSADSLAMLLEITGNKTYLAHDGVEAIEAIEKHRPQVVLLDIGLPKMDGHEVCRRVRKQPWGKDILVIALTGWGQDDDRRKSEEAGFNGHLVKPVDYDQLLALLRTWTNER